MTARWPQHHLVAVVVIGLIVGPRWPWLVALAAAAAWVTQPRPGWATLAVVAVGVAAVGGQLRTAQAWSNAERPMREGPVVRSDETVEALERPRPTLSGGWRFDGRLRGATVDLRTPVAEAAPDVRIGERLRVRGRLRRAGAGAVGTRSRGIALTLHVTAVRRVGRRGGWRGAIDRVRERAERTLAFGSGVDPRTALLRGMVLGQDDAFGDAQQDAYRRSGLSHLVAASGQNVALVAAIAIGIGALLGVRRGWRLAAAIGTVAIYVPLAGAGPSIRRAGVMGVLVLLALALGRLADRWWALLVAALITVLVDPFSPEQLGWQLSFAAVLGLLLLVEPLATVARRIGLPGWAGKALAVPVGAGLTTAPVLAASVGDVSLTSVAANVLVEPFVAPITWLGVVAGTIGPEARPLSGWAVVATGPLLDWINGVAVWAAAPEWAVVRPTPAVAVLPMVVLGSIVAVAARPGLRLRVEAWFRRRSLCRERRHRRWTAAILGAAFVAIAAGAATRGRWVGGTPDDTRRLRGDGVVVLDVGQGSATLLRQRGRTILVDAGPAHGRILDRLAAHGVERLDVLILSHAAADHTGGAPAVARRLRPRLLIDGRDGHADPPTAVAASAVRAAGGRVVAARRGLRIRSGALAAEVRWPPRRAGGPLPGEDPNDRAAVIRATVAGLRVLVPSDLEGPPLRHAAGGPVDVLVLPHHGSADDDVPALLRALRPRRVVAQVGARNRYGHPAPSTVAAVRAAGVPLRRTDRDGSVVVPATVTPR